MRRKLLPASAVSILLVMGTAPLAGVGCKTDCNRKCRVRLPFGGSFTEPACLADCEIKKAAACAAGSRVPDVPGSPSEVPGEANRQQLALCASEFEVIAKAVILDCSGFRAPSMDAAILGAARQVLADFGVVRPGEFRGVSIRFCDLRGSTAGIVPDRNTVLLDVSYNPVSRSYDRRHRGMVGLAALLAHEMVHVGQYRHLGTDEFKCRYAERWKACGGCQDANHPLERPAYAQEDRVYRLLEGRLRYRSCNLPGGGRCDRPGSYYGEPCTCYDPQGRPYPGLIAWPPR